MPDTQRRGRNINHIKIPGSHLSVNCSGLQFRKASGTASDGTQVHSLNWASVGIDNTYAIKDGAGNTVIATLAEIDVLHAALKAAAGGQTASA